MSEMVTYDFRSQLQIVPFGAVRFTISLSGDQHDQAQDHGSVRILRGNTAEELISSYRLDDDRLSEES